MTRFFKALLFFLVSVCATFLVGDLGVRKAYAYDVQCVATGVVDYMTTVIETLDPTTVQKPNIKLLTPTFNMSEPDFENLYKAFRSDPRTVSAEGALSGTIGNAYNFNGHTVGYWVNRINNVGGPIKEMHLAETGRILPDPPNSIPADLIATVAGESGITLTSANLFAARSSNPDWVSRRLSDGQIRDVCNGDCGKIGNNFATAFDSSFYGGLSALGLKYVVGIVSSMGDVSAVVDAAYAGFVPIVRIGYGDCSSSTAGDFEDAMAYAGFIDAVASAVGNKTVYFIVGPNEPDVEQWWSLNYGDGKSCGCSTGGVPPISEEDFCNLGPYGLIIKGTVKSNRVYNNEGRNPLTGNNIYTPYTYGTQADFPIVNNLPVGGAVIQLHHSFRASSLDTRTGSQVRYEHTFNTGLLDGMLKQSYINVTTNSDGTFEIAAKSDLDCKDVFRSDWKGLGYEQFLSVSCSDQPTGREKGLYSKDNYGMILNIDADEGTVINYGDINVDCDVNHIKNFGAFPVSNDPLKLINRERDVYMSCSGERKTAANDNLNIGEEHNWNQGVRFDDSYADSKWPFGEWWDKILEDARKQIGLVVPFGRATGAKTETRVEIQNQDYDLDQLSVQIGLFTGIKGGFVERPNFYYNPADATAADAVTYNGQEEKPKIYTCEEIRRCNTGIGEDNYPNENAQSCGGAAFNLAAPFGGIVKGNDGKVVLFLSQYLPRFANTNKDREICSIGNEMIKISDIMPPDGYCGDIDGDNLNEPSELSCPKSWTCGDQNGNGFLVSEGEVDCSTVGMQDGSAKRYKLDVRYFPYFAMFSPYTIPMAESETRRTYTQMDSYHAMCPRGLNPNENYIPMSASDPSNASRPMSTSCEYGAGSDTFYTQEEVKFPGYRDNQTNYATTLNFGTAEIQPYQLPFQSIGTPQFVPLDGDPVEVVEKAIAGMTSTLSYTKKANFFRIGTPDNLCSCSLVEMTGAAGLGNCSVVGGDPADGGAAPNPVEPSNLMTVGRDEGDPRNAGNYLEWANTVYNPLRKASQVAGGADWAWDKLYGGAVTWRHGATTAANDKGDHYVQPITSGIRILQTIQEYVDCKRSEGNERINICPPLPSGQADDSPGCYENRRLANVGCDRIVDHLAQNKSLTAWGLPPFPDAPLVFAEAFFPPEVQLSHEFSTSVSLENSLMTKAQVVPANPKENDMPGNQATGQALSRGADYVKFTATLSNLVSAPSFDGLTDGGGGVIPPILPPGPSCGELRSDVSCGGGCVTNTSPSTWGDVHIEFKNLATGNPVSQAGPSNIPPGGSLCIGAPGTGNFKFHVTSNSSGCQQGGGFEQDITCP